MYRLNSIVDGIIIDYDSLSSHGTIEWHKIANEKKLLFIVSSKMDENKLSKEFGEGRIILVEDYEKIFLPNPILHAKVLARLRLKTSNIVYVSADKTFVNNALAFMSGVIWINNCVLKYEMLNKCPDLICNSIEVLREWIFTDVSGYLGEISINPLEKGAGTFIQCQLDVDRVQIDVVSLGRYFGYTQYMSQLHPYSSAIFLNKLKKSKSYGKYNNKFAELLLLIVKEIVTIEHIDAICTVPSRPGCDNRYDVIIEYVSQKTGIKNIDSNFRCKKNYDSQKALSRDGRSNNVKGVFEYTKTLSGRTVILFDDIITTGATISECVRQLKRAGAIRVIVIVLAINQQDSYWSSDIPEVKCSDCGSRMRLLFNSNNLDFFYSCTTEYDHKRKSFVKGRDEVTQIVDSQFTPR